MLILEEAMRKTKNAGIFLQNCKDLKGVCSSIVALYDGLAMARQVNENYELQKRIYQNNGCNFEIMMNNQM